MTKLNVDGNKIRVWNLDTFTSGQVGARVEFQFNSDWDGLSKTAVFEAHEPRCTGEHNVVSSVVLDSNWDGNVCRVPARVLETPGYDLSIGVYGLDASGALIIPTVYAKCGRIARGARTNGAAEDTDPSLPIWGQLQSSIGNLNNLNTSNKQSLVDAINEAAQSGGDGGGVGSTSAFTYTQGSASDEWTIQHNLGKYPSVTIVDSGGNVVVGDVQYLSTNEISISFAGAFSGKAYLN